jgi:hypothetical protein
MKDKTIFKRRIVNALYKMLVAHVYGRQWLMELTAAKACRETGGIGKDKPEIILYFL